MNESVKKSLEKSKNVLEEKAQNGQAKNLHKKTNTFTIITMSFVQEQLKNWEGVTEGGGGGEGSQTFNANNRPSQPEIVSSNSATSKRYDCHLMTYERYMFKPFIGQANKK